MVLDPREVLWDAKLRDTHSVDTKKTRLFSFPRTKSLKNDEKTATLVAIEKPRDETNFFSNDTTLFPPDCYKTCPFLLVTAKPRDPALANVLLDKRPCFCFVVSVFYFICYWYKRVRDIARLGTRNITSRESNCRN